MVLTYKQTLTKVMSNLVEKNQFYIIGQGAIDGGHGMSSTIEKKLSKNCIELPVFEETQTGIALGMGLTGTNIISIYPRFDFFISGLNQLINHSDKLNIMSQGKFRPTIIFRVGVGAKKPLDGGPQHTNNYTKQLQEMLTEISVHELVRGCDLEMIYGSAVKNKGIHLIVEHYDLYEEVLV